MSVSAVGGVRADIAEMLSKIRDVSNRSPVFSHGVSTVEKPADFGSVFDAMKSTVGGVSDLQAKTESVKNAYLMGDPNVSLSQVIVSSEKSKLAFEGLVTVRNKCLEAYKEIMSMPV